MKIELKYYLYIILLQLAFSSCNTTSERQAREAIVRAVEAHGGGNYERVDMTFDFRTFHFHIQNSKKNYTYTREFVDSIGNKIKDTLKDGVFVRNVNGEIQNLSEKEIKKYSEATNSVAYFMLVPYKLLDRAVHHELIDTTSLNGQRYSKIKVWFEQEGGGYDHKDVFTYWINRQTHLVDYFAYANGGPRFRKAISRDTIGGIIFQNYENYEILDKSLEPWEYDEAFANNKAKLLSIIDQKNYQVVKR